MPADRLLGTLLRSLQTYTEQQDTPRLLATASHLLTTLQNPQNTTLLTTQLLTAPALWGRPDGLLTCLRFMGVFHSAAKQILTFSEALRDKHHPDHAKVTAPLVPGEHRSGSAAAGMGVEEWARAVLRGADERSARWKHMMVIGGLLLGFEEKEGESGHGLSRSTRVKMEEGLVQAANLALVEAREWDELGGQGVCLCLNHCFGSMSDLARSRLDYDLLLPVLVGTAFFSSEGYQSAYFLGAVDLDVVEVKKEKKWNWPASSSSFQQVQRISTRPLVSSMGPFSRLVAHAVDNVKDPWLLQTMMDDLTGFARALTTQWRGNKLSEVDISEEKMYLADEALKTTLPKLWKVLKSALFATTIVLRGVMGRVLNDGALAADGIAPVLVTQTLHTLRSLSFIYSRLGATSFSQHTFVYLTAIDIITQYPIQADAFLKSIAPSTLGTIPSHPLDRTLDLYFLNTAEHFTLVLSPQTNDELLVAAAAPYLATGGNNNMLEIFEAAHSVMLSVLSAPQSAELAAKHLPFYVDALFKVFPDNLSPRQFRLAFKTLLRVTAPPSQLSATQPDLPATLLELVHYRTLSAPTEPLKPGTMGQAAMGVGVDEEGTRLSEQAVLVLTLLDALPYLPIPLLEEWLPLAADLLNLIENSEMREVVKKRFWEVLISGEMDPERSQICVGWWSSRGGREQVLYGRGRTDVQEVMMSGALNGEGVPRESKL